MDPLVCTLYGQRMSIVAFVTGTFAIRRILDHLGLSSQQQEGVGSSGKPILTAPQAPYRRAAAIS